MTLIFFKITIYYRIAKILECTALKGENFSHKNY